MNTTGNLIDLLQDKTGGRPYAFVIMKYDTKWPLFERMKAITDRQFNLICIRADDLKSSGYDLLEKVHLLISRAEVVIAEISSDSPNVFYEVGYAVAMGKRPLLLVDATCREVPVDLRGLEIVHYREDQTGCEVFDKEFAESLRDKMNVKLALVRDMLEAPIPLPAYIVASPKYPGRNSRILSQVYDKRTFSDNLGIRGLLGAFGSSWGHCKGVELISAEHSDPQLTDEPYNLYLIGSSKVNKHVNTLLDILQKDAPVQWFFDPAPGYMRSDKDWPVALYEKRYGQVIEKETKTIVLRHGDDGQEPPTIVSEDYGIILRAPHPNHVGQRIVLILAGAHSLGTSTACVAATRHDYLQKIHDLFPEGTLANKQRGFWVLVKGIISKSDYLLDEEKISLEDWGVLPELARESVTT